MLPSQCPPFGLPSMVPQTRSAQLIVTGLIDVRDKFHSNFCAMRERLQLGAVLLLVFVVFMPSMHYELVYDDFQQLVTNPRLTAWSYVPGYFTSNLWSHLPELPHYYRPVFLLWFRLLYATLGAPSSTWHFASILAHVATTACVFVLIRRLVDDFKGAALAAVLFAIHPIDAEPVAWVSSAGDPLVTIFLTLSVSYYVKRMGPVSLCSILFAALAMFTKEAGIVAPPLILAYEWTHSRLKNAVVAAAPYALPALLYLAFRVHALGNPMKVAGPTSLAAMIFTWPRLLSLYALHLIWPVHLGLGYDVPVETAFWPLLLLLGVIAGLGWLLRGSSANIRFGAAWFGITLIPSLAIRYIDSHDYVHDRYLYLPTVGLALVAAVWFARIRFTRPRVIAAGALALALCWGTRANLRVWQNNISLFSRAIETDPQNPDFRNNLAVAYIDAHRESEAYPLLKQLIEMYPWYADGYYNMGYYYQQIGNPEEAKRYYLIWASKQHN